MQLISILLTTPTNDTLGKLAIDGFQVAAPGEYAGNRPGAPSEAVHALEERIQAAIAAEGLVLVFASPSVSPSLWEPAQNRADSLTILWIRALEVTLDEIDFQIAVGRALLSANAAGPVTISLPVREKGPAKTNPTAKGVAKAAPVIPTLIDDLFNVDDLIVVESEDAANG